jgi:hypothetical protein
MTVPLYSRHTPESATAAFGPSRSAAVYLDGDFVVLDDAVVCLFTTGPQGNTSLQSPSRLDWSPRHEMQTGGSGLSWWPTSVVEVFDRSGPTVVRKRRHQMFLRPQPGDPFLYAGPAHLCSHGADRKATFELSAKLPREAWTALGGYSGWLLELEHEQRLLEAGDDAALDAGLAAFASRPSGHFVLTRYEEDSLHVFKNERRAWLMYLRTPEDSGLYLEDWSLPPDAEEEHFCCDCGIDLQYPAQQTLPLPAALDIARYFFRNGTLPIDRHGNPVRVPKPSRDAPLPAEPAGFVRDPVWKE